MSVFAVMLALLLAFLWAGSFVFIQAIVVNCPPVTAAFWRITIATATLLPIILLQRRSLWIPRGKVLAMVAGAICMGIPWSLLFWAEIRVNGALGGIMNGIVPIVVLLCTPLYTRNHEDGGVWAGVLLAFSGIVVIFGPRLSSGSHSDSLAVLALFGMVMFYANGVLFVHRFLKGITPLVAGFWQGIGAGLSSAAIALVVGQPLWTPALIDHPTVMLGVLYVALFSTAFGNTAFIWLVQKHGSVLASLVTFLIPLFAILLEWYYFGTPPTSVMLLGTALVLLGLYVVQFRKKEKAEIRNLLPAQE